MIDLVVAVIFVAVYVNQYQKIYSKKENTKHDDFLLFMCFSFVMLTVAMKFFRPLSRLEAGLRKLTRREIGR